MPEAALSSDKTRPGIIVSGPFLPESLEVLAVVPMGESLKIIGKGLQHLCGSDHAKRLPNRVIALFAVCGDVLARDFGPRFLVVTAFPQSGVKRIGPKIGRKRCLGMPEFLYPAWH
jgi:hypothetical protein